MATNVVELERELIARGLYRPPQPPQPATFSEPLKPLLVHQPKPRQWPWYAVQISAGVAVLISSAWWPRDQQGLGLLVAIVAAYVATVVLAGAIKVIRSR